MAASVAWIDPLQPPPSPHASLRVRALIATRFATLANGQQADIRRVQGLSFGLQHCGMMLCLDCGFIIDISGRTCKAASETVSRHWTKRDHQGHPKGESASIVLSFFLEELPTADSLTCAIKRAGLVVHEELIAWGPVAQALAGRVVSSIQICTVCLREKQSKGTCCPNGEDRLVQAYTKDRYMSLAFATSSVVKKLYEDRTIFQAKAAATQATALGRNTMIGRGMPPGGTRRTFDQAFTNAMQGLAQSTFGSALHAPSSSSSSFAAAAGVPCTTSRGSDPAHRETPFEVLLLVRHKKESTYSGPRTLPCFVRNCAVCAANGHTNIPVNNWERHIRDAVRNHIRLDFWPGSTPSTDVNDADTIDDEDDSFRTTSSEYLVLNLN